MKKNLRNILALALGLMTTVSFAQDMNVDSRTRIDMSGDGEKMSTAQRVTVGTTWGGDNWGIVLSSDVNYTTNDGTNGTLNANVYEAYASTDLFGFATMNIGRQALSYGSGVFVGTNDWAAQRNTTDGMTFAIDNDLVGLDLGVSNNDEGDGIGALQHYWINASKSSDLWNVNLFFSHYSSNTNTGMKLHDGTQGGLDFKYSVMSGALDLNISYNAVRFNDIENQPNTFENEFEMMDLSATYIISNSLNLTAGMISVGEDGFYTNGNGNMGNYGTNSWLTHGNIGHLGANQENLYFEGSYEMGKIKMMIATHSVSNTENEAYDRQATELSAKYSLSNKTEVTYKIVSDNNGSEIDTKYNWLTITMNI
jgi:hypothetical protein|tara:strand:- start:161 stop:1261 length:1101 start_codon:yes stop_codon:yes gene_type:complete